MWGALLITTLAGLSTGLGGLVTLVKKPTDRLLALSMGFAGGVMLTVSLADMLPGALQYYLAAFPPLPAGLALVSLLAMGMVVAALLARCLPEDRAFAGAADGRRAAALRSALVTGMALLLHNRPEGVLTLFTGVADPKLGLRMALAIALHNLPEGIAVAVPLFYATGSRAKAALAALASGLAEPAGALLAFAFFHERLNQGFLNGLLVLVAGIMSWVSISELIPGSLGFGHKGAGVLGFALGICLMMLGIACLS